MRSKYIGIEDPPVLTSRQYEEICKLALDEAGIAIGDNRHDMLASRLTRRLRSLGLSTYTEYLELVSQSGNQERVEFINAITTNLTFFFRESYHFEFLQDVALPKLHGLKSTDSAIRIWSAGCSSGQEPYSIAITARSLQQLKNRTVKILCTDIHTEMVNKTKAGIYNEDQMRGINDEQKKKWFDRTLDGCWLANKELRNLLVCKCLNLFSPWPVKPSVDIIFCRNTIIYFTPSDQQKVLNGFANIQKPGAYLFLGHSENIGVAEKYYKRVGNTVYERKH